MKTHLRTQVCAPFWKTAVRFRCCRDSVQIPVGRYDPTKHRDLSIQLGVVFLELMELALPEMSALHLAYSIHYATSTLTLDPSCAARQTQVKGLAGLRHWEKP